jgi:site-specific recombinase XerD
METNDMDYRSWAQAPANFPGKYGTLFMKFIASRQAHRNVTDATVVWYCCSWKAFRDCVSQATNERELRQHLWDGITAISKRGTGPVTTNTYIRCLQAFVNWMLELEYIERRIKLPKQKTEERIRRVLSVESIEKLFHFKPRWPDQERIHAACILMLDCGLRASEWINLRLEDLDLKNRMVRVWGKGRKERFVPMSQATATILFNYLAARPVQHDLVFATKNATPLLKRNAGHMIKRMALACGIPPATIGLHGCRHTMATQFIAAGGSVVYLQKILGHVHISTTMQYVHTQMADIQRDHMRHSPIAKMR